MVRKKPSSLSRGGTRSSGSPLSVVVVLARSFLLLWISFSVNILGVMVYLIVRPWSRAFARRLTGQSVSVSPGLVLHATCCCSSSTDPVPMQAIGCRACGSRRRRG